MKYFALSGAKGPLGMTRPMRKPIKTKKKPFKKGKPSVVIAHTVKGKGVSFMENSLAWHYKSPTQEQYEISIKEINAA